MGDRCYTRFSVPLSALTTVQRRHATAAALGLSVDAITAICAEDATANMPVADYANDTHARLVDGAACLVFEDDQCDCGGCRIEDDLQSAGIPFLQFNDAGSAFGPSRSVFTGVGDLLCMDCDSDGHPLIRVDVIDGKAAIDPAALALVRDLLAAEHAILHPTAVLDAH